MSYNREHRRRNWRRTDFDAGEAQDSPLVLWVASLNRTFDFSTLSAVLPEATAELVAGTLCLYFQNFSRCTAIGRFTQFKSFMDWLSTQDEYVATLRTNSLPGKIQPGETWCSSVDKWVSVLRGRYAARYTTLAENIGSLFLCLDALRDAGIAPKVKRPKLPANYHSTAGRRPTLSELQGVDTASEQVMQQVQEQLGEVAGSAEFGEALRYVKALSKDIPRELANNELAFAEAIQQNNRLLLDKIRFVAEDKFLYWQNVYRHGQDIIKLAETDTTVRFKKLLKTNGANLKDAVDALFPTANRDLSTGRFLVALSELYGDRIPSEFEVAPIHRYRQLLKRLGGRFYLDAMLTAHPDAVAAALILYICDSGANVSPALELTTDFEEPADDPNRVRICSVKPRAGYTPIIDTLPIRDLTVRVGAVEALRAIREMTKKRRERFPEIGNQLAIHTVRSKPSNASSDFLAARLSYFVMDAGLKERFLASSLRHSVMMDVALRNDGSSRAVNAHTHHRGNSGTTEIYSRSWPVRLVLTRRIREFQTLLEASFVFEIEDGLKAIGVTERCGEELYKRAIRTGLGLNCKRPFGNDDAQPTDTCRKLGQCPHCERSIFLVDEDNLAELLAIQHVLNKRRLELESEEASRWESTWADLLAYATVVIEKVEKSHLARYLLRARIAAEQLIASGFDPTLLRPV